MFLYKSHLFGFAYTLKEIYDIRKIDKANFHEAAHSIIDQGSLDNFVQGYVDVIGGREWITIPRVDIIETETKSLIGWHIKGGFLSEYLKANDIIEQDLLDYVIGCVPPIYPKEGYVMMGEPMDEVSAGFRYMTFTCTHSRNTYIGLKTLAEFKQYPERFQ